MQLTLNLVDASVAWPACLLALPFVQQACPPKCSRGTKSWRAGAFLRSSEGQRVLSRSHDPPTWVSLGPGLDATAHRPTQPTHGSSLPPLRQCSHGQHHRPGSQIPVPGQDSPGVQDGRTTMRETRVGDPQDQRTHHVGLNQILVSKAQSGALRGSSTCSSGLISQYDCTTILRGHNKGPQAIRQFPPVMRRTGRRSLLCRF